MKKLITETAFDRALFFSDAIVAIAITLLALNLKINTPDSQHLTFADLLRPWREYLAFGLSFLNIAAFWRMHHQFFMYIRKMDDKLMFLNICWLFCIVILPFSTNILSVHFGDTPAIFLYSLNIFLLSVFQNSIWDYSDMKADYVEQSSISSQQRGVFRNMLNLDMLNGLIAIILSFFFPVLAFFVLFFKLPLFIFGIFFRVQMKKDMNTGSNNS